MKSVKLMAWMKSTKWEGIERFLLAERKAWRVNEELARYLHKRGGLSHVVLLGAGHLEPVDQPLNSQAMI
ncbi:hypothetical protein Patl1_15402 [Pistacia atlantica]|nr:hypothetical protein Patl1_15402 [Pistacia atlantica]